MNLLQSSFKMAVLVLALASQSGFAQTPVDGSPSAVLANNTVANLPPWIKSKNDKSQYRRFVLPNGLKVILLSDPKLNKSSVSLTVEAGTKDDPADAQGMAHYLEHMLFLGTKKYPDEGEFDRYINNNAGSNNAYTATAETNYGLDIRHEAFAGAVDRLAQFFIAPLFTPAFASREVNAVNNEAARWPQFDWARINAVARELYRPGHPMAQFGTGNAQTLKSVDSAYLTKWYESYYSSDRMALAMASTMSLDDLERLAREHFSAVPKRAVAAKEPSADYFPKKNSFRIAFVEPVRESRSLQMEFTTPTFAADFASRPDVLLSKLIDFPGQGGLVDQLKQQGLVLQLSSGFQPQTRSFGQFVIAANLTPLGQQKYVEVVKAIHTYLATLRQAAYPVAFYNDNARIAQIDEQFADRGEGMNLAMGLATNALFYPLEITERVNYVWASPNEKAYRTLLNTLTPDNALTLLLAKDLKFDKKESIYGFNYSYQDDPAFYAALVKPITTASAKYTLPGVNPYMPTATKLLAERPVRIASEPGLEVFYLLDSEFLRPESSMSLRFIPHRRVANAKTAALLSLYTAVLTDQLTPTYSLAGTAGTSGGASVSLGALDVTAAGYGDSPQKFLDQLAPKILNAQASAQRFAVLKEQAVRGARSYIQNEAFNQAQARLNAMTFASAYTPDQLLPHLEAATWPSVQTALREFLQSGKIEAMVAGQLSPEQALTMIRTVTRQWRFEPASEANLLRPQVLKMASGEQVLDAGAVEGPNSAYVTLYQLSDNKPSTRAAMAVLSSFLSDRYFSELRTNQQLGYIVRGTPTRVNKLPAFISLIQSSQYAPDHLRTQAESFLATMPSAFTSITDEEFETLRSGALSELDRKSKNVTEKLGKLYQYGFTYNQDWEYQQETIDAMSQLSKAQVLNVLQTAFSPQTARRVVMLTSKAHNNKTALTPSFTDRSKWKGSRQFQ